MISPLITKDGVQEEGVAVTGLTPGWDVAE